MLIASLIEIIPRGTPSLLTTGRWRTFAFVILSTAVTMFSFGLAFRDVFDMMLETGMPFPVRDLVTEKSTSRSVTIPTITPALSTTMTLPMFPSHIADAASSIVVSSGTTEGGTSIRSLVFMPTCLDFGLGKVFAAVDCVPPINHSA